LVPRLSILPAAQQKIWPALRAVTDLDFVLYGGTAIALRLGHRISVDFDFFTGGEFDPFTLRGRLPFIEGSGTLQSEPQTLTVSLPVHGETEAVKLSFFGGIGFADPERADMTDDGVAKVAALIDLMATKLVVLQKRVEAKDYQDIAAMLRAGVDLSGGLDRAGEMYGRAFQASESLKAMVYFEGGDLAALSNADRKTLVESIRSNLK
jgi:hypothetical protein